MDGKRMYEYADDTHSISSRRNSHTRQTELKRVEQWAKASNLKLNSAGSLEIIFKNSGQKFENCLLPALPDVARATLVSK